MSTSPHSENDDLDRTDELPRLDIEAYEAQLATQQHDTLGSTDTWAVQHLREAEDLDSPGSAPVRFPRRSPPPEPPRTSDVTLDATRILERIQQLEAELAQTSAHERELLDRAEQLTAELAARERDVRGLSADNARLTEQRSIFVERVRSLEQQLHEESTQFARDLAQQRDLRAAENAAATTARAALEQQVAELTARMTQLRQTNARLDEETRASAQLANTHMQLIEQLRQRLAAEEKNSAQLARLLAAKIAEHATVGQEITRRDATIQGLTEARDDLAALLDATNRDNAALIASLTAERDELSRTITAARESQSNVEATLDARAQEIDALQGSSAALQAELAALREQLAATLERNGASTDRILELERDVEAGRAARDALTSDVESLRTRLQDAETKAQRDADAHTALTAQARELAEARDAQACELAQAREDFALVRQELEEFAAHARERDEQAAANAAELAAARRQLQQQASILQSLEQAIRARDSLLERVRAELQMSHDERSIIAGQLEKSRARNKAMAREIFARDSQIGSLKADLAIHAETLAAIRQDVNRTAVLPEHEGKHPDRVLEPVGHEGDLIVLDKKTMTIGRTSDNDICIASKLVSRSHARLLVGPNAVIVEDAGSTNGCLVNDVLVKQQLMRDGDVLAIGDLKYRLRTRPAPAPRTRGNVIPFGEGRGAD